MGIPEPGEKRCQGKDAISQKNESEWKKKNHLRIPGKAAGGGRPGGVNNLPLRGRRERNDQTPPPMGGSGPKSKSDRGKKGG